MIFSVNRNSSNSDHSRMMTGLARRIFNKSKLMMNSVRDETSDVRVLLNMESIVDLFDLFC